MKINDSDLTVNGEIQNALPYYLGAPMDLKGSFTIRSEILEWDDFIDDPFLLNVLDPQLRNSYSEINFIGEGSGRIKGRALPTGVIQLKRFHTERSNSQDIRHIRGTLGVLPNKMGVKRLTGMIGESDFTLHAELENYPAFTNRDKAQDIILSFSMNSRKMRVQDFLGTKDLNFVRIDTLENTLTIEDGILNIPLMDLNSTIGHLRMAGFQNVNGEMEYLFQVPLGLVTSAAWNYLTGRERKEEAEPDEIQTGKDNAIYISVRVVGTIDEYSTKLGKGRSFREMVRQARRQRRLEREQRKQENNN